jgi:para-nitrobenzyl esterase
VLGNISMTKLRSDSYVGPMIDERLVHSDFVDGFIAGREAAVPLIVGSTGAELSHLPFLARYGLRQWAKKEQGDALEAVRNSYGSSDAFDDHIVNDWGFAEPARIMASRHAARGFPTWLYSFDYVSEANRSELGGAPHASDVTFVFGTLGREGIGPTDADWQMSRFVRSYWLAFARAGTPSPDGLSAWPRYDTAHDHLLRFNATGPAIGTVTRGNALDAISRAMAKRRHP